MAVRKKAEADNAAKLRQATSLLIDRAIALIQAAANKRAFADAMLKEAEEDLVKARLIYDEMMDEMREVAPA